MEYVKLIPWQVTHETDIESDTIDYVSGSDKVINIINKAAGAVEFSPSNDSAMKVDNKASSTCIVSKRGQPKDQALRILCSYIMFTNHSIVIVARGDSRGTNGNDVLFSNDNGGRSYMYLNSGKLNWSSNVPQVTTAQTSQCSR